MLTVGFSSFEHVNHTRVFHLMQKMWKHNAVNIELHTCTYNVYMYMYLYNSLHVEFYKFILDYLEHTMYIQCTCTCTCTYTCTCIKYKCVNVHVLTAYPGNSTLSAGIKKVLGPLPLLRYPLLNLMTNHTLYAEAKGKEDNPFEHVHVCTCICITRTRRACTAYFTM